VMPEICHSFVSRYVVIASAARNERERPVLLASFSSLLLVERSTRTESVSVFKNWCSLLFASSKFGHSARQVALPPRCADRLLGAERASYRYRLRGSPLILEVDLRGMTDTAGDGILAEFSSVVNAVKSAVAIQSKIAERNAAIKPEQRIQFRMGVNIGDVIYDDSPGRRGFRRRRQFGHCAPPSRSAAVIH
jgi:class 3 adenylate cyclase